MSRPTASLRTDLTRRHRRRASPRRSPHGRRHRGRGRPGAPGPDRRGRRRRCTPFLHVDTAGALAAARAVDAKRAAGRGLGPLAGVPLALKDIYTTRGVPTTAGSKILEGWIPPYDATVTRRLLDAGVVILGKTNLDEFAMGSSTENSAYGPTRNPWDLTRIPGGSGGGSAAALAAYEAPLAIGTDTGGSIRQPAAVTGIVGHKPTYGAVSRYGLIAFSSSLDQAGPFARTVLDAALLHEVIAGYDPLDSTSIDAPVPAAGGAAGAARRGHPGPARGHRQAVRRRGLPTRRDDPLRGVRAAAARPRRPGRRGGLPVLRLRHARLLPDRAVRVLLEPGPLRRDALRAAGRRRRQPLGRGGHRADPRGRLRPRGQAPDHPGHLRPVLRVLRRVLRPGAEGPHADQPRLRRAFADGGRPGLADHARPPPSRSASGSTTRWPCTWPTCAPSRRTWRATCGMSVPCGLAPEDGLPVGLQIMAPALADDRLYRVGGERH